MSRSEPYYKGVNAWDVPADELVSVYDYDKTEPELGKWLDKYIDDLEKAAAMPNRTLRQYLATKS